MIQSAITTLKTWWDDVNDRITSKAPKGSRRSSQWGAVRDRYISENPRCECCGGTKNLRVHHVIPFDVDPSKELDEENLMVLCEAKKYGINCHLLLGHYGNWRRWSPLVRVQARMWNLRLRGMSA